MLFSSLSAQQSDRLKAADHSLAIIEFATDGTILDAMGYSLAEIKGKHHSLFVEPSYAAEQAYRDFWENLRKGEVQQAEFMRLAKGGKVVWIEASYAPIISKSGHVEKIIKFATDITKRKLIADDLRNQIQAVHRSNAVIEFTLDGIIVSANQNFMSTVGYSAEEIIGKHHSMFVEPDMKNSSEYAQFWQKLKSGEFFSAEYKRVGKGGKVIWLQASYNPIKDSAGVPYKVPAISLL
ncbi:MAG: PAS domain-containing protein [Rickettsiales bacterium]|nr:PAS domain-containing protein [Rickettsiales bacterium]